MYRATMKELVEILMGSPFYFELALRERFALIRHIREISARYRN